MAISMDNSPLHDLPPGTTLYFNEGGLVTRAVYVTRAAATDEPLTIPERLVMEYYDENWELGAMHCSGEACDGAETF